MSRALVHLGPARKTAEKLTCCEQLFLARWLQLLYDEVHPRWSLRPLSLGNLGHLYRNTQNTHHSKQLVIAIEDEVLRRLDAGEPDAASVPHPGSHSDDYQQRERTGPCPACATILAAPKSSQKGLLDLVEELIESIGQNDEHRVLLLTPAVVAEAVATGVPPRYMMQTCRNYVLNPNPKRKPSGSFRDRLVEFLLHGVARQPRSTPPPPSPTRCSLRREILLKLPSAARIPSRMGSKELGFLEMERKTIKTPRRLWITQPNVDDILGAREDASATLRTMTPGWLALLRFCFPELLVQTQQYCEVNPKRDPLECPGHRQSFSHRQVGRNCLALERLIADDTARASLYWLSLAYHVWGESIAHAAGMVWMGVESLVGNGGLAACATDYVNRLQSQLADDIEETLGVLAGDAASRAKGLSSPRWVRALPWRCASSSDAAWLTELAKSAGKVCDDPAMRFLLNDAASLASPAAQQTALAQAKVDLRMLRSMRHAIAHSGKPIAEEPVLHYLATLGCECIRAMLARRLDGTPFEGVLEGRPVLFVHCEPANAHWHSLDVPAWIAVSAGEETYACMSFESKGMPSHKHEVTLTKNHRERLARGECVEVLSTKNEGHSHLIRLSRPKSAQI